MRLQVHLVTRTYEFSALHPDVDSSRTEQFTSVREWMTVDGLLIPRTMEKIDISTGEVIQRSEVLSAELVFTGDSPPTWIDGGQFEAPTF